MARAGAGRADAGGRGGRAGAGTRATPRGRGCHCRGAGAGQAPGHSRASGDAEGGRRAMGECAGARRRPLDCRRGVRWCSPPARRLSRDFPWERGGGTGWHMEAGPRGALRRGRPGGPETGAPGIGESGWDPGTSPSLCVPRFRVQFGEQVEMGLEKRKLPTTSIGYRFVCRKVPGQGNIVDSLQPLSQLRATFAQRFEVGAGG